MKYLLDIQYFGGRGADFQSALKSYQNRSGSSSYNETIDLPARMNRMFNGNNMSFEHTLDVFRDAHAFDSKQEHGILMDENGFVNFYVHGDADSVFLTMRSEEIRGEKITSNKIAVHNHPNNSFYSKADLTNFAMSPVKSTVVVGKTQDYILTKTSNFYKKTNRSGRSTKANVSTNQERFYNYINRNSYSDIEKFLKDSNNQKKYGFTFSVRKH